MESTILPKPWKYKDKWLVWPNTVLDVMDVVDCSDTINGVCIDGKSFEECMEVCIGDCGLGYYIKFRDGRSICAPIRTVLHPHLNPVYRLRRQEIYPQLDHVSVSTYINTDKYSFPPDMANVVFYDDILEMKNTESGLFLDTDTTPSDGEDIKFGNINPVNIQFMPAKRSAAQISNLNPVKYGDYFTIIVPGTSLSLRVKIGGDRMNWISSIGNLSETDFTFQILPIDDSQKIGDLVTYGSTFNIIYSKFSILVVDNNYDLTAKYYNVEDEKNNPTSFTTFTLISKMTGYYCDGKECKSVPLSDIETNGQSGTYNGSSVGRSKGCWGICRYVETHENNKIRDFSTHPPPYTVYNNDALLIVIMSLIVIIGITLIHLYFRKKD